MIIELQDDMAAFLKKQRGKMSLEDFAQLIDTSDTMCHRLENGLGDPRISLVARISRTFKVPVPVIYPSLFRNGTGNFGGKILI
jgi:DNA-binding XRE family transcriptional regulator